MIKHKICKILLVILAIFLCVAFYELLGICVAYKSSRKCLIQPTSSVVSVGRIDEKCKKSCEDPHAIYYL